MIFSFTADFKSADTVRVVYCSNFSLTFRAAHFVAAITTIFDPITPVVDVETDPSVCAAKLAPLAI